MYDDDHQNDESEAEAEINDLLGAMRERADETPDADGDRESSEGAPREEVAFLLDAVGDVLADETPDGPRTLTLDVDGVDAWIDYDADGAHVEADLASEGS